MSDLTRWQDNALTCTKNLPSHTEAYIKTWSAKFCQPKAKVGQQHDRHCQMPTLIQRAGSYC